MMKTQVLRIRRQRVALSKTIENIIRKWLALDYEVLKQRFVQVEGFKNEFDAILNMNGIYRVVEVKSYIGDNEKHISNATSKTSRFNDVIVIEATVNVEKEVQGRFDICDGSVIGDSIYFRYNILSILRLGVCLKVVNYEYYHTQEERILEGYYKKVFPKPINDAQMMLE